MQPVQPRSRAASVETAGRVGIRRLKLLVTANINVVSLLSIGKKWPRSAKNSKGNKPTSPRASKPTSPQASKLTSQQAIKRPAVRESTSAQYRSNHPLRGKVLHDSLQADRGSRNFHKVLSKRKRPLR